MQRPYRAHLIYLLFCSIAFSDAVRESWPRTFLTPGASMIKTLETDRLLLRAWKDEDVEPFIEMNEDSDVMRFFPFALTAEQSCAFVERIVKHFEVEGFGLFAAEVKSDGRFIGFIGLHRPTFESSFTPCVEIGWRLAKDVWGKGYAPEGAKRVLSFGFEECGLKEILSWTSVLNTPSIRVMQKIGMVRGDDFLHPNVPESHVLCPHVMYKLKVGEFNRL
jgi:ribosomal-protein-alanine N-acetyltransferase